MEDEERTVEALVTELNGLRKRVGEIESMAGELRRSFEALRRSEQLYRAVVEDQTELICRFTPQRKLTFVNGSYCRYFGRTAGELIGSSFLPLVYEADRQMVDEHLASICMESPTGTIEHRVMAGAEVRWHQWTNRAIFDESGVLVAFQSVGRDVTPIREAETRRHRVAVESLKESEHRYRLLMERASDGIFIVDSAGRIVEANQKMCGMLGYAEGELVGMGYADIVSLQSREAKPIMAAEVMSGETVLVERQFVKKDGSTVPVEVSVRLIGGDTVQAIVRDITEREKLDQVYSAVIGTSMDGFQVVDAEGYILEVNDAFCRAVGFGREEIIGRHVSEFDAFESVEDTAERLRYMKSKGVALFETCHRRKDGTLMDVEISVKYLPFMGGRYFAFIRDISERQRLSEERLKARKLESLASMARGLSHDFNNILAIIMNNLELIQMQPAACSMEYLERAFEAVKRGKQRVDDLLIFSRVIKAEPEPLDLGELAAETMGLMSSVADPKLRVEMCFMPGLWKVMGDRGHLKQAILNLYENARDSLAGRDKDAKICCSVDNVEVSGVFNRAAAVAADGEYVRLTISDNGCGMDNETLSQVFDPFFSTKGLDGRGIGLSTTYGIVVQMGGWIDVQSAPSEGTVVRVYIPRYIDVGALEEPLVPDRISGGSESVLIVDDERGLADGTAEVLRRIGYNVLVAYDGDEALKVFMQNSGGIDLVVTDLIMPGLGGIELVEKIRESGRALPIIMTSGAEVELGDRDLGAMDVRLLVKPYGFRKLADMIREVLGGEGDHPEVKDRISRVKLYCVKERTVPYKDTVTDSGMVYELFKHIAAEPREKFIAVFLDSRKSIIAYDEVAQGTVNEATVYPQEILRTALLANAAAIILVHNHPSGDASPSRHDRELTRKIMEACRLMGIEFLDHVIIGEGVYFSVKVDDTCNPPGRREKP